MTSFVEQPLEHGKPAVFAPWSVEDVLSQMTIDEKVSLLSGKFFRAALCLFLLTCDRQRFLAHTRHT